MSKKISFTRPDGGQSSGYYVEAGAGEHAPGMVVIQEWWGLNDQIKGVADRLADQGYRALVPDLYKGKMTLEEAEAAHLMNGLDFTDAATQDVRGAVQFLKQTSPKVGVIGFCMGGALAVLSAVHVKEADAVVCWYGMPPADAADVTQIRIPLQGHFAEHDEFFPADQVRAVEKKLKQAKVKHEFFWYDAQHAFGNETLEGSDPRRPKLDHHYDPEAAALAWRRTFDFLAMQLKS
jgi:carboxymethylenebutenolidase